MSCRASAIPCGDCLYSDQWGHISLFDPELDRGSRVQGHCSLNQARFADRHLWDDIWAILERQFGTKDITWH